MKIFYQIFSDCAGPFDGLLRWREAGCKALQVYAVAYSTELIFSLTERNGSSVNLCIILGGYSTPQFETPWANVYIDSDFLCVKFYCITQSATKPFRKILGTLLCVLKGFDNLSELQPSSIKNMMVFLVACFMLSTCLAYFSALKTEAVCSSETSGFPWTT
jgi:hypothetical protein